MKLDFHVCNPEEIQADSLVLFCHKNGFAKNPVAKLINALFDNQIKSLFDSGEFSGSLNEKAIVHGSSDSKINRVILVGLGPKSDDINERYRQASGTVADMKEVKNSSDLAFYLDTVDNAGYSKEIMEGFILGSFKITAYKTGDDSKQSLNNLSFFCPKKSIKNKLEKFAGRGLIIAEQASFTRLLASTPGNDLTPRKFVSIVQKESKKCGVKCSFLDEKQIKAERMGAFYSVAKGSDEPPRFLIMEYAGSSKKARPIVLVGKGITFDSGGISLKASLDMHHMKSDMSGAAAVAGAVTASARLGIKQNVIGLIPLAENLPSGKASKPGDIVTSRKGKTIEVINTDAEGRLILADGLDYANEFNPQAVINICTLTGGATYILGYGGALLMGNNDKLKALIKVASDATAERTWELPLWEEYGNWMRSDIADLRNSGGKWATSITAGAFLQEFIGNWPWAHIDIASVDYHPSLKTGEFKRSYIPKGYTGFGMRLLVEMLDNWKSVGR